MQTRKDPSEVLIDTVDAIFVADGVDVIDAVKEETIRPDNLTRLTTFLGLPNRILDPAKGQSWTNILYNFIGYQPNVSDQKRRINNWLRVFVILFNLIATPWKFLQNVAKVFAQFVPKLISDLMYHIALPKLIDMFKEVGLVRQILLGIVIFLTFVTAAVVGWVNFVGRAATTPIDGFRVAWHNEGKLLGIMSAVITFGVYAVLFPLMLTVIAPALNMAVVPFLSRLGESIAIFTRFVIKFATFGALDSAMILGPVSPALIAIGGILAALVPTAGVAASSRWDRFTSWLHRPLPIVRPDIQVHLDDSGNTHKLVNDKLFEAAPDKSAVQQTQDLQAAAEISLVYQQPPTLTFEAPPPVYTAATANIASSTAPTAPPFTPAPSPTTVRKDEVPPQTPTPAAKNDVVPPPSNLYNFSALNSKPVSSGNSASELPKSDQSTQKRM